MFHRPDRIEAQRLGEVGERQVLAIDVGIGALSPVKVLAEDRRTYFHARNPPKLFVRRVAGRDCGVSLSARSRILARVFPTRRLVTDPRQSCREHTKAGAD